MKILNINNNQFKGEYMCLKLKHRDSYKTKTNQKGILVRVNSRKGLNGIK